MERGGVEDGGKEKEVEEEGEEQEEHQEVVHTASNLRYCLKLQIASEVDSMAVSCRHDATAIKCKSRAAMVMGPEIATFPVPVVRPLPVVFTSRVLTLQAV